MNMSKNPTPAGRRPRNDATLKHTDLLGGFDYLRADYTKQTFLRHSHEEYLVGVRVNGGMHPRTLLQHFLQMRPIMAV